MVDGLGKDVGKLRGFYTDLPGRRNVRDKEWREDIAPVLRSRCKRGGRDQRRAGIFRAVRPVARCVGGAMSHRQLRLLLSRFERSHGP